VTLSSYWIGKYEVTNLQYADVLKWALAQGYLKDAAGDPWTGTGDIYGGGNRQILLAIGESTCNIQYSGEVFSCKTRVGLGNYSMDTHPVIHVSWYGAVAFCNWLSEWQGVTPCYDMSSANWPLTVPPPTSGGYRLPTEAEWERAAAWDGSKHWIYGFTSDTLTGKNRCNYRDFSPNYVNPLGLTSYPYTSPVGWFDGVHMSPNGSIATVSSTSPVGCYDMSGNVWEWCHDWHDDAYYSGGSMTNPTGPPTACTYRVMRDGCGHDYYYYCRSASRDYYNRLPSFSHNRLGFRVVRTP